MPNWDSRGRFAAVLTGTTPAAGAVPVMPALKNDSRFNIFSINFSLTTAIAVANRRVTVMIREANTGVVVCSIRDPEVIVASTTIEYTVADFGTFTPAGTLLVRNLPLPFIPLVRVSPGTTFSMEVVIGINNIQAADQCTALTMYGDYLSSQYQ